tara:strand:- start:6090 stop:7943 length:1854 start_codon:yes stop_codon:yes gene_type:complete
MSKKVTGNDLKNLVKEVLLNEVRPIAIPTGGEVNTTKNKPHKYLKTALRDQGYVFEPISKHRVVSKVQQLAGRDGNAGSISTDDLEQGLEADDPYAQPWLDSILQGTNPNKSSFVPIAHDFNQASLDKGLHKAGQGPANFGKVFNDYLRAGEYQKARDILDDFQELIDLKAANFGSERIGGYVKQVKDALEGDDATRGQELKVALKSLNKAINTDIERSARQYRDIAGPLDVSTPEAEVSGLSSTAQSLPANTTSLIQADSALLSQFELFDFSKGVQGFFQDLADTAGAIESGTMPTNLEDAFEFIIKANVVNRLGSLSKVYDISSAGFEFEKLLAVALGGAKVGGDSGAADVLGILSSGDVIHTSQKLVTSEDSKQSYANTVELLKSGKKLYYTFLKKVGGSDPKTEYNEIKVYISSIYTTDVSNPVAYTAEENRDDANIFISDLYPSGKMSAPRKVKAVKSSSSATTENSMKIAPKEVFAKIPLVNLPTNSPEKLANFISGQIVGANADSGTAFQQMANKIIDSFKIIKNIERNTQEYNSTRAKKQKNPNATTARSSSDYVTQIAKDYVELKSTYESIFKDPEKKSATVDSKQVFTEQKVTADFLKKLIQENFKK